MRSSHCRCHAVTDSTASLLPAARWREGLGGRDEFSVKLLFYIFGGRPEHPASPVSANTSAGAVFVLLWGHRLDSHDARSSALGGERRRMRAPLSPTDHANAVLSLYIYIYFFLRFQKLMNFSPTEMSRLWASLGSKSLFRSPRSFFPQKEALLKEPLRRRLKGGSECN